MKSLQGHFLVAAPHQVNPNFIETVILVVEHMERGAFGVIVNCPREESEKVLPQGGRRRNPVETRAYFGGPVAGPLMAVHMDAEYAEIRLLPGVFFSGREDNVLELLQQTQQPYKVFTGYSGWGAGQLEREVEQGVWRVITATSAQIFADSGDLWEGALRQALSSQFQAIFNLRYIPSDPLLN